MNNFTTTFELLQQKIFLLNYSTPLTIFRQFNSLWHFNQAILPHDVIDERCQTDLFLLFNLCLFHSNTVAGRCRHIFETLNTL